MIHVSAFSQHHIYLTSTCPYACFECAHSTGESTPQAAFAAIKAHDVVNVYGGGTYTVPQIRPIIRHCRSKNAAVRLWGSHALCDLPPGVMAAIQSLMIWCPSPDPQQFDYIMGSPQFHRFLVAIKAAKAPIDLVHWVRPLTIESLPLFQSLCESLHVNGLILYHVHEFTKEERRYITRFKRVPGMRVLRQSRRAHKACLAVPTAIQSLAFEYNDWRHRIRKRRLGQP
jgi:hypothetical protein